MKRVYVAGPVGAVEGRAARVRAAIDAGELVAAMGLLPFVPHLYDFWNARHDHDYEFWMQLCLAEVRRCDALYRMPGMSPGADREVALAGEIKIAVFTDLAALRRWARGESMDGPLAIGDDITCEQPKGFRRRGIIRLQFQRNGETWFRCDSKIGAFEIPASEARKA